jgi:hypothetical protein
MHGARGKDMARKFPLCCLDPGFCDLLCFLRPLSSVASDRFRIHSFRFSLEYNFFGVRLCPWVKPREFWLWLGVMRLWAELISSVMEIVILVQFVKKASTSTFVVHLDVFGMVEWEVLCGLGVKEISWRFVVEMEGRMVMSDFCGVCAKQIQNTTAKYTSRHQLQERYGGN